MSIDEDEQRVGRYMPKHQLLCSTDQMKYFVCCSDDINRLPSFYVIMMVVMNSAAVAASLLLSRGCSSAIRRFAVDFMTLKQFSMGLREDDHGGSLTTSWLSGIAMSCPTLRWQGALSMAILTGSSSPMMALGLCMTHATCTNS